MSNADAFAPMFDVLDEIGAGAVPAPWLFLNAEPDHRLQSGLPGDRLVCITPNKARHDRLQALGIPVAPERTAVSAGLVLVRITRDRTEALGLIAEALAVAQGAPILVFGENDEGIRAIEKLADELFTVEARQSKRHARCFAFRAKKMPVEVQAWSEAAISAMIAEDLVSQPGLFSHDRLDPGSSLLIKHLPANKLKGAAADFGCGWGALSIALLRGNPGIISLDLLDIDHRALAAAARNVAATGTAAAIKTQWVDLAAIEGQGRIYDVIVMNPPFHASNRADPAIGAAFLHAESTALKPGGLLVAVSNRKLT